MFISPHAKSLSGALLLTTLMCLSVISVVIGLYCGSVPIHVTHTLLHPTHSLADTILFQLRLPRVLCAFVVGGSLALAGAFMQTLLRNPLADPYVLGVSGGAASATLIAICLGVLWAHVQLYAWIGSFFSMWLVMFLSRMKRDWSSMRLLLTGVVVATGWAALISFILAVSPNRDLRGMLFWLMGDLSYAQFSWWTLGVLLVCLLIGLWLAQALNILVRGNLKARSLGVETKKLQWMLYVMASVLTACAVSMAGCIGFIGLIVPHILRLLKNSDHRFILPACVLLGGSLLTLADTLARTALTPIQLPVGVVTALIGVPLFLLLLRHRVAP